jgi:hypothetical protein
MSGDPNEPASDIGRAGQPRQKLPAASPRTLPSEDSTEGRERSSIAKFAGVGLQFAVTILVAVAVGNWLAKHFANGLYLYLAVFLGAGAAFYSMYRQLMANLEREEAAKRARAAGQSPAPPSNEQ